MLEIIKFLAKAIAVGFIMPWILLGTVAAIGTLAVIAQVYAANN